MPRSRELQEALSVLKHLIKLVQDWLEERRFSIRFMKEIAEDLGDTKKNVNIAKLVGSSAGIIGGVLIAGGVVVTGGAALAAVPFLYGAGMTAAITGGIVSGGAEIALYLDSKHNLKLVQNVLDKDKSKHEEILKKTNELRGLISKISQDEGISEKEVYEQLFDIRAEAAECPTRENVHGLSVSQVTRIALVPVIPYVARTALPTVSRVSFNATQVAARGAAVALTPILVAIDLYQLVTSAKNVHTGSKSEAAQRLLKAAEEMEEELKQYEELLDACKKLEEK